MHSASTRAPSYLGCDAHRVLPLKSCARIVLLRDRIDHISSKSLAVIDRCFNRNRWSEEAIDQTLVIDLALFHTTAVVPSSSKFTKMSWQCQSVSMDRPICSLIEASSIRRHQPRRHGQCYQGSYHWLRKSSLGEVC